MIRERTIRIYVPIRLGIADKVVSGRAGFRI